MIIILDNAFQGNSYTALSSAPQSGRTTFWYYPLVLKPVRHLYRKDSQQCSSGDFRKFLPIWIHNHEVPSSILGRATKKLRHLQFCRCLFCCGYLEGNKPRSLILWLQGLPDLPKFKFHLSFLRTSAQLVQAQFCTRFVVR